MKRITVLLLSLAISVFPSFAADTQSIAEKIRKTNASYASLEFKVKHVKTLATKAKVEMEAVSYYNSDNRLAMHYTNPDGDKMIVNGNRLYINRAGKAQTFDLNKVPSMKTFSYCIIYALAGRIDDLAKESGMDVDVKETPDSYIMKFTARQKAVKGYSRIEISYRKSDCVVTRIEMEEFSHVVNVIEASGDIKVNKLIYGTVYNIPVQQ